MATVADDVTVEQGLSVQRKRIRWLGVLTVGSAFQFSGCVDSFGRSVSSGVSGTLASAAVAVIQGVFLQPIVEGILADDEEAGAV